MFSTIIRVCCDGGMGNTHIGSRKKDWIVERECKGYLRRGRDKSSVTTKIVALQPQGWEVVNNNYPKGLFFFQFRARSISRCQVTIKKREEKEWHWQTGGKCWRELSKKATSISTLCCCGHMLHPITNFAGPSTPWWSISEQNMCFAHDPSLILSTHISHAASGVLSQLTPLMQHMEIIKTQLNDVIPCCNRVRL